MLDYSVMAGYPDIFRLVNENYEITHSKEIQFVRFDTPSLSVEFKLRL